MKHMKRTLASLVSLLSILIIVGGCQKEKSDRYLVITDITHFRVQGGERALKFSPLAGTLDRPKMLQTLANAEMLYQKLAGLYDFKDFQVLGTRHSEYISSGDVRVPLYRYPPDGLAQVSVDLESCMLNSENRSLLGRYRLRIDNMEKGHTMDIPVDVPDGQSVSVGALYDEEQNAGHLVVIIATYLSITDELTVGELSDFLIRKNLLRFGQDSEEYISGDQQWMDELFPEDGIVLDIPESESDHEMEEAAVLPEMITTIDEFYRRIKYPELAKMEAISGKAVIRFKVDSEGKVIDEFEVLEEKPGSLGFAESAWNAIQGLKFKPARDSLGTPIPAWMSQVVNFKMN